MFNFFSSTEGCLLVAFFFGLFLLLLGNILRAQLARRTSDLHLIPSPPVPLWRHYILGHLFTFKGICSNSLDYAAILNQYRKKYGPVFLLRGELGEVDIIVTSEEGLREVSITKHSAFVRNAASQLYLRQFMDENGIFMAEGSSHTKLRRAVLPAMHHQRLIALEQAFLGEGKALAENFARMGAVDDVLTPVRKSTFFVIFKTCFGMDALSPGKISELQKAYDEALFEPAWIFFVTNMLKIMFWFLDPDYFTWRRGLRLFIKKSVHILCEQLTERGMQGSQEGEEPLLSLMINEETSQSISSLQKTGTILSFLLAGQLTTSFSVCWTLYLLGKEEKWQQRLLEELQQWNEEDGLEPLDCLPLLNNVVKESIRMYPPIFFISRVANQPVEISGYRLPAGVQVHIPVGAIHRNKDIWGPDADEFNPDRFLQDDVLAKSKIFWCAFLFGPRSCLGRRFAILETKAFVAQVLKRQRIFIKPWKDSAPSVTGVFAAPLNMKIYFESR